MTVNRVLKRLEEAEDGAPELQMDAVEPEPVAEDLEPEEQEAEAVVIGPDTLGKARVGTMGDGRNPRTDDPGPAPPDTAPGGARPVPDGQQKSGGRSP